MITLATLIIERRQIVLLPLLFALLFGCSEPVADTNEGAATAGQSALKEHVQESAGKPKTHQLDLPRLTNNNCVEWLLKYGAENPENLVRISTELGDIELRLYTETPVHRANFIRLIKEGYFSQTLFHRVEEGFIVQGGKGDSFHESMRKGYGDYMLPPELHKSLFHKRGALAAARPYEHNSEKRSSPFDYYMVQGSVAHSVYLDSLSANSGYVYSEGQREYYTTVGGAPHLDGQHTVFGEITAGLSVLDKIAAVPVDDGWWPQTDIFVEMEVVE